MIEKLNFEPIIKFVTEKNNLFLNLRNLISEFVIDLNNQLNLKSNTLFIEDKDYNLTIKVNINDFESEELFTFVFNDEAKNYFLFKSIKLKQQSKRFYIDEHYIEEINNFLKSKIIDNKKWQSYFYLLRKSSINEYQINFNFEETQELQEENK